VSLTSWGENMRATVESVDDGTTVLRVSGQPRVGIMSTPWGEELHAAQIEQQLFTTLDATLAADAAAWDASGGGGDDGGDGDRSDGDRDDDGDATSWSGGPRARDIMTAGAEVVDMDDTVADAAELLAAGDIGALPICNRERRLQGMLTDRDIVVKVVALGRDPASTKVSEIAQGTEVVTIGADDSLEEALRTMKEHKVRRLPVIDGTDLVGMISQGDLAQHVPEHKVGDLLEAISAAP
jgi:CBS domain-containing protein